MQQRKCFELGGTPALDQRGGWQLVLADGHKATAMPTDAALPQPLRHIVSFVMDKDTLATCSYKPNYWRV